jgi:3-phytase
VSRERKTIGRAAILGFLIVAAGCTHLDSETRSDSGDLKIGVGVPVLASGETQPVGTKLADAADDPEVWADPRDPSRVVIFGTDKQAGLYSYGLDGKILGFIPDGRLNNVDLRPGFPAQGGERVLVAASDRDRKAIALYLLNPDTLQTVPWGIVPVDLAEPYGLCLGRRGLAFVAIINGTDGEVRQFQIGVAPDGSPRAVEERRFAVGSQTEGCVIDDAKAQLYIGEESLAIWRYPLDPGSNTARVSVARTDSSTLKADIEGLTLLREDEKTWLIASSQGDSAFAVWRVEGDAPIYRGRFSVIAGRGIDAVTGTDGVAALGGQVGPYAQGLVVVQDDVDTEGELPTAARGRQNFKLIDWRLVKVALGLD